METPESANGIPSNLFAEMRQAAEKAAAGIRDREEMRRACERMDRTREKIRRRHGLLDIAMPSLRELRDEE